MSDYHIAQRSGVSQPTVHRILSGENPEASFAKIIAIAEALGIKITVHDEKTVSGLRENQAYLKAGKSVDMTQGTSALEGQGLDPAELMEARERLKQKLLAGSAKNLWSE